MNETIINRIVNELATPFHEYKDQIDHLLAEIMDKGASRDEAEEIIFRLVGRLLGETREDISLSA